MTLKRKISFVVSILFSLLFGVASIIIYGLYANFRKEEFKDRLEIKTLNTVKLFVNATDKECFLENDFPIDQSIDKLQKEQIFLFDQNFTLINGRGLLAKNSLFEEDLSFLKTYKSFFKQRSSYETFGLQFKRNHKTYYLILQATDSYGKRKLTYLQWVLCLSFLFFTTICWFATYYCIDKVMQPFVVFLKKIKDINEYNLDTRLELKKNYKEIDMISNEFNQMMDRIEQSYQLQKEFTANVSHELRTPLSRISAQIENKLSFSNLTDESRILFQNMQNEVSHLSELINSLLLLTKIENKKRPKKEVLRLDEVLFDSFEKVGKMFPDINLQFDMKESDKLFKELEREGHRKLMEVVFTNLLKNGYLYSDDKTVDICVDANETGARFRFENSGQTLTDYEVLHLFEPFVRGANAGSRVGFGLGLRLVERILAMHEAHIYYEISDFGKNAFIVQF